MDCTTLKSYVRAHNVSSVFPWAYPKAARIPASANPEPHRDEQAWAHIPPNRAPLCQREVQESWLHIRLRSQRFSLCGLYVLGVCEGSGLTSVWPGWLLKPQDHPCNALAENPRTMSVLPPLHMFLRGILLSQSRMLLTLLGFTLSPSKPKTPLTFLMQPSKCQNRSFWEIHISSSSKCWKWRGWVRNVASATGWVAISDTVLLGFPALHTLCPRSLDTSPCSRAGLRWPWGQHREKTQVCTWLSLVHLA